MGTKFLYVPSIKGYYVIASNSVAICFSCFPASNGCFLKVCSNAGTEPLVLDFVTGTIDRGGTDAPT